MTSQALRSDGFTQALVGAVTGRVTITEGGSLLVEGKAVVTGPCSCSSN